MKQAAEVSKAFEALYHHKPRVFRAPGRVNLIGEHTDYNDGFVMPAAIEFSTWVAAAERGDRKLAIYSENFSESREFPLDDPEAHGQKHWSDYVRGVAVALERTGHKVHGADLYIRGEVPIGSGLSSSAAIEVSTALALLAVSGISLDRRQIALLGQRAENVSRCVEAVELNHFHCAEPTGYDTPFVVSLAESLLQPPLGKLRIQDKNLRARRRIWIFRKKVRTIHPVANSRIEFAFESRQIH